MICRRWTPTSYDEVHYFRGLDELNKWLADFGKGRAPQEIGFVLRPTWDGGPQAVCIAMRIAKD